jgi:hypothetical protein
MALILYGLLVLTKQTGRKNTGEAEGFCILYISVTKLCAPSQHVFLLATWTVGVKYGAKSAYFQRN